MTDSRGWSGERQREYDELVGEFEDEGRYEGREEEVAARIVNKQRAEQSETRQAVAEDRAGESPDRDLPIRNYDRLTVDEIVAKLGGLSDADAKQIKEYEQTHRNRKTLLERIDQDIDS